MFYSKQSKFCFNIAFVTDLNENDLFQMSNLKLNVRILQLSFDQDSYIMILYSQLCINLIHWD